jgi:integrase
LQSLDSFLVASQSAQAELTAGAFAGWCETQQHLTAGVRRNRMRIVRNLCLYRRRTEPACFVPDPAQFPSPHQTVRPYIFTEAEIARLVAVARALQHTEGSPLRPETYHLAVVLLYTTGLRRGELLRLRVGDYNHSDHTLLVGPSKFHRSRCLPVSLDASRVVDGYLRARQLKRLPSSAEMPLLWNGYTGGRGYSAGGLGLGFRTLLTVSRIHKSDGRLPRIHDFRHTFAVHALLRWYRSGTDVQTKLPLLAAYMGHVSIISTHYYLHFVEPLATIACARFSRHCGALVTRHTTGDSR